MVYTIISETLTLSLLGVAAFWDKRTFSIPVLLPAVVFCAGFTVNIISGESKWWQLLLGCIPGIILLVISLLSSGSMGLGDGLVLTAAGPCLGLVNGLFLLTISLIFASAVGFILIALHQIKIKDRIPFIPFVLGGYIILLLIST